MCHFFWMKLEILEWKLWIPIHSFGDLTGQGTIAVSYSTASSTYLYLRAGCFTCYFLSSYNFIWRYKGKVLSHYALDFWIHPHHHHHHPGAPLRFSFIHDLALSAQIRQWKSWEDSIQKEEYNPEEGILPNGCWVLLEYFPLNEIGHKICISTHKSRVWVLCIDIINLFTLSS